MRDHGEAWRTAGLALALLGLAYISLHPHHWTPETAPRPSRADTPPDDPRGIAGMEWGPLG